MKGRLHPDADAEFADAVRYYSEIDPDLGVRFYREIERLIRGRMRPPGTLSQVRSSRPHISAEFPYAVIYLEKPDHVWIVAVMHMKRRPGYWKERLD